MEVSAGWELRTFCEHLPCNLMHPDATWWHYIPHGFRVIELLKGDENSLVMRRSGVQIPEAALCNEFLFYGLGTFCLPSRA